ncbi:hypothetical protein RirG_062710 [Rhizophagus irregularis DAOM 197198w]|uniref:TLDc domain-containing protein n=1 Tax=Rhizophagus irregularis (strain DAOM 197198w) TaxID=1432141 RepID=A0A015JUC0_RHIIW|nr:hypothetical protein RirG_062710 [Rhizophagus irregularis DAOM 197198w]
MEQNFTLIYRTSFENDSFLELQKYCNDLMSKEPDRIFNSLSFTSIPENILISLIQNENLQMNEVQVWEHALKWGHAQNQELSTDPTNLSKNDFYILKDTLRQCIPLIKFYNFTSKEFLEKVLPYKKILPKDLYKDLLRNHLSVHPDNKPIGKSKLRKNIDSKIITLQHTELISKWINGLQITDKLNSTYEFKLILRGSRDGFSPKKFHEICVNRFYTVSIIKVKDSDEILGGYNPITWNSNINSYGVTNNSFLFSFKNNDNLEDHILSRIKDGNFAIFNNPNYGPSFGNGDIILSLNNLYRSSSCIKNSYKESIRETDGDFFIEEYEVFLVIKN